jgi:hypothetical protein
VQHPTRTQVYPQQGCQQDPHLFSLASYCTCQTLHVSTCLHHLRGQRPMKRPPTPSRLTQPRRNTCTCVLAAPFAGPYQVVAKGAKSFTIQMGQRPEIISADLLKAHTSHIARCLLQRPPLAAAILRSRPQSYNPACDIMKLQTGGGGPVEDRRCTFKYIYRNMSFTIMAPIKQLICQCRW